MWLLSCGRAGYARSLLDIRVPQEGEGHRDDDRPLTYAEMTSLFLSTQKPYNSKNANMNEYF